jgi:proteasome lid subunit RPN8/RPN11
MTPRRPDDPPEPDEPTEPTAPTDPPGDATTPAPARPDDPAPSRYTVLLLDAALDPIQPPRPIVDVAETFLTGYLGPGWAAADNPILLMLPYPSDDAALPGDPPLRYASDAIGYIQVRIRIAGHWLYRHPHTAAEVLGPGVRAWVAALAPAERARVHAFRIDGPGIERLLHVAAPVPLGVTEVTPYAAGERPGFRIRPIPPAPPPARRLAELAAGPLPPGFAAAPQHTGFVKVVMEPRVAAELERGRRFSDQVEQGGFLVGEVFEDADAPDTFITLVKAAVPAEQVGASFLHFTFTGDSFDAVKARLATEHRGSVLLGWYHTHLFPATEAMGLSSIDYRLHFTTFRIPWQIAGLLNLDGAERVLRYYVRRGEDMLLCHHQTSGAGPAAEAARDAP